MVLDTVMVAKSGARLLDDDGVKVLREELLPLADIVTANVPEAAALTGQKIVTIDDAGRAAERLVSLGAPAAIVKGGHLEGPAVDVLYDGRNFTEFSAEPDPDAAHPRHGLYVLGRGSTAHLALGHSLVAAERRPPRTTSPKRSDARPASATVMAPSAIFAAPDRGRSHS